MAERNTKFKRSNIREKRKEEGNQNGITHTHTHQLRARKCNNGRLKNNIKIYTYIRHIEKYC